MQQRASGAQEVFLAGLLQERNQFKAFGRHLCAPAGGCCKTTCVFASRCWHLPTSSLAKLPAFEPEQSVTSSVRDEKLQQALANSCSTIGKTTSQTLSSCVRLFIAPDAHQNDSPGHTRSSRTITGWSSRVSSSG